MSTSQPSISVSREIAAPAAKIFEILASTTNHPKVDGSDMLREPLDDLVISGVGDVFAQNMFHPDMGHYTMENHVVEFEAGHRILWEPRPKTSEDIRKEEAVAEPGHYVWGWEVDDLGGGTSRVTESFDCSRSPQWLKEATQEGEGWREAMEASLTNLQALVV